MRNHTSLLLIICLALATISAGTAKGRNAQMVVLPPPLLPGMDSRPTSCKNLDGLVGNNDQAASYDLCDCSNVDSSVQIDSTWNEKCQIGYNTAELNGVKVCEELVRRRICKEVRKQPCKDGAKKVGDKCPGKCKPPQVEKDGKCVDPTLACKDDEKLVGDGCVKQCKKGETLTNGKCIKDVPNCKSKRQCQMHWVQIMKSLKTKIAVLDENIRRAETSLKNRRLQAVVQKKSLKEMKDERATLNVEMDNAKIAIKACKDSLCPDGMTCNQGDSTCKKVQCTKDQEIIDGKCQDKCKDSQLRSKDGKCSDRCKPEQQWKDGKCSDRCKPEQQWKDAKCSDRCKLEQQWKDGKCSDRCKPDQVFKNGICVDRCRPLQVYMDGKCSDRCAKDETFKDGKCIQNCAADEKLIGTGCVKTCKSGKELKNGKCVKIDPSCRTKRQCQIYWVTIMKGLKTQIAVAKEQIRRGETTLKSRRLQSVEPKLSLNAWKNKLAASTFELQNSQKAIKLCTDATCPDQYACNKTNGTCKKVECAKYEFFDKKIEKCSKRCPDFQVWNGQECVNKCEVPGTTWKDGKCVNLCQPDEAWDGTKCSDRCPKGEEKWDGRKCVNRCKDSQAWKYSKCVDRCPYGQSWNTKSQKCVSICKDSENYIKGKCISKCKPDEKWDAKSKKCAKICKEGTTYTNGTCKNNCKQGETWKNGVCAGNCKNGEKWHPIEKICKKQCNKGEILTNGKCVTKCPDGSFLDKEGKCITAIKLYAPLQNFWRQNREREDTELMMAEFKRTAMYFGNRVDQRVHREIKLAQDYLARLKHAHGKASTTFSSGQRIVGLWEAIAPVDKKKLIRRLRAIHKPMVRRLQKMNKKVAENADAKATSGMPDFGDDAVLMKAIGQNFKDPVKMIEIEKPLKAYDAELDARTDQLSQLVERIRKAYDAAKINNEKAKKLLEEESVSQKSAMSAQVVLTNEQKFTTRVRSDKAANFPQLPKEAYSLKL